MTPTDASAEPLPRPLEDVTAVIQAAGRGERLGRGPKAFLSLGGRTLLERAVTVMRAVASTVLVAVPADDLARGRDLCGSGVTVIAGGTSRGETLIALLAQVVAPWVVLHDVVHPFVTPALTRRVIEAARTGGAAVAAIQSTSTAYRAEGRLVRERMNPGDLWFTTKPWAFRRDAFVRGLAGPREPRQDGIGAFLRRAGQDIVIVPAEPWNIKLTAAGDWHIAEALERSGPHA